MTSVLATILSHTATVVRKSQGGMSRLTESETVRQ